MQIDLVITDLSMPGTEGMETIRALHQVAPGLKIIAMSGQFAGLLPLAKRLGAHASLAKPIDPDQLLDAVAQVMGGSGK